MDRLILHEHPEAAKHYDTAPHRTCRCRVCGLKREIAVLHERLLRRNLYLLAVILLFVATMLVMTGCTAFHVEHSECQVGSYSRTDEVWGTTVAGASFEHDSPSSPTPGATPCAANCGVVTKAGSTEATGLLGWLSTLVTAAGAAYGLH
jgi:hypothetical protein